MLVPTMTITVDKEALVNQLPSRLISVGKQEALNKIIDEHVDLHVT